jgi:hypothetical protein
MSARDDLIDEYGRADTAPLGTLSDLKQKLDAYRAEVLAEAELLPKADVVAWLAKKAREDTPVWLLASKVERGAIRANNLRMLPADFFEPGHTYVAGERFRFRCDAVTSHPDTGEIRAIGWHGKLRTADGEWIWVPNERTRDDWDGGFGGWTDVTEGGEQS